MLFLSKVTGQDLLGPVGWVAADLPVRLTATVGTTLAPCASRIQSYGSTRSFGRSRSDLRDDPIPKE
jgi:hypothetical protein